MPAARKNPTPEATLPNPIPSGPAASYLRNAFEQHQRAPSSSPASSKAVSIAKELSSSYEADGDVIEEALSSFIDLALRAPKSEVS